MRSILSLIALLACALGTQSVEAKGLKSRGNRVGPGSAVVTFLAPRLDENQAAITTIAAYVVKWGTTQGGPYPNSSADLAPPAASATWLTTETTYSHTVSSLSSGTWYFVVYTKDAGGNLSDASIEQSKVIP